MNDVFLVWHTNPLNGDEKLTGVYSTQEKAEQSVQRLLSKAGFRDSADGFEICCCGLDEDQWTEGFVSSEGK